MSSKDTKMETIMPQDAKAEAEEVMAFLGTLDQDEEKEMLAFVRGAKFGRRMAENTRTAASVAVG